MRHLRTLLCCVRCSLTSAVSQHSWQENPPAPTATASCSSTFSWHNFSCSCVVMKESIQLKGNQIFAGLAFSSTLFPIEFTIWLQKTCTLPQRSGLCAEGQRDYFWPLDAGTAYSAFAELQPKGTVAARIARSSGKENSSKESICCLVVAWPHSLRTSTTGAEQDCKEVHSTRHLHKTGQGDPLCLCPWSMSGNTENQPLRGADQIKNTGCRCIYYVNKKISIIKRNIPWN